MIKVIIFDWGGVIFFYRKGFVKKIASEYKINFSLFRRAELENRLQHDVGGLTTKKFVHNINRQCDSHISVNDYYALHSQFVHLSKGMIKVIEQLKKRYKIFLLSNNSEPAHHYIQKNKKIKKLFDKILFSYQVGLRKPDPRFFQHILKDEAVLFSECLFIDDRADSVAVAKKLGMHGLLYTNLKNF